MLAHPIETLPGVRPTLEALHGRYRLVLVTKGDLFDQERKLAESGLGELFHAVEVVSRKDESTYRRVFALHGSGADDGLMVGNSVKSDILPALAAGAWAAFIPHPLTWIVEHDNAPAEHPRFHELQRFDELLSLLPPA
jgi:putative hydrolase of the HAD superfamily